MSFFNFHGLKQRVSTTLVSSGVPNNQIRFNYLLDMRYLGQGYTIEVTITDSKAFGSIIPTLKELFEDQYSTVYSQVDLNSSVEITTWKVNASGPSPAFPSGYKTWEDESNSAKEKTMTRKVYFREKDDYFVTTVVKRASLEPGATF